jgi:hypothetical protein
VGVKGVQVLLATPVEALGALIHALLDGGVRDLFDQDANLHLAHLMVGTDGRIVPR